MSDVCDDDSVLDGYRSACWRLQAVDGEAREKQYDMKAADNIAFRHVLLPTAPQHSNGDLVQPCTREGADPGKLLVETVTRELHVSQLLETAWLTWPLGVLYGSP